MVDTPTAAELKLRYPEFCDVADNRVDIFIDDAALEVDDTWLASDQKRAISALAAHLMKVDGVLNAGVDLSPTGTFLKRRKVGDTENEYALNGSGDTSGGRFGYDSTSYGATYKRLLKLNHRGPRVV